ncbi:germination protein, GerC family [Paenibacillus mucilaginosus 3016]|uniref:Germination protein, GerC family n=1 Tax=Paenibacillus mucilaginosus 3016 TaxID=1116391 RepID=H6NBD1_9BACL|nr:Ger(x)C family spore germination protein [Paenibacillus mucilaginosus]AFC32877.1 germination protein, GerC family [Paenibacillus mucilaginosus 3016]WFA21329.1 Ger(x)C family spore germination protein [Paenibacillus mucilaginosus]
MNDRQRNRTAQSVFCLLCGFLILTLTGCWNRVEVNDLALIMAAGIDKKDEDGIELTAQIFIPKSGGAQQGGGSTSGSGGAQGQTLVRTGRGVTIADAMSKLQEALPRKIFWGHTEVFIIGEQLARSGIREQLDFILRFPQMRERSSIFICKGTAKQVMEASPPLERSTSEVLREMTKSKQGLSLTVNELAQMLSGDSKAAIIPWVEPLPADRGNRDQQPIPYIMGTAVFKKDQMIGRIDDKTTRGVLWLRDEVERAIVTVAPEIADKGYVSFVLLRSSTELIPSVKGDQWSMTVKIETEDDVIQNTTKLDIMKPEITNSLEKELEKDIISRVNLALTKAQKERKVDIFGFNEVFHRHYPKQWEQIKENWEEKFPEIEVRVLADAKIRRPGSITSGGTLPEEEVMK